MSDRNDQNAQSIHPVILWLCRLVALAATILAAYLGWHSLQSGPIAGCDAGSTFSCDELLQSNWSRWFGIPVGILAVPIYGSIFAITWFLGRKSPPGVRQLGWILLVPLVVAAGLAAVWFTGLQLFDVKKICTYCMGTHLCGLFLLATLVWHLPRSRGEVQALVPMILPGATGPLPSAPEVKGLTLTGLLGLTSLGVLGFVVLVGGQLVHEEKSYTFEKYAADADPSETDPSGDDLLPPPIELLMAPGTASDNGSDDVLAADVESPSSGDALSADVDTETPNEINADLHVEATAVLKPVLPKGRQVVYLSDKPPLIVENEMLIGKVDAEYIAVELMDYTCPACRKMYLRLLRAHEVYGDRLAVAIRPIALEKKCNPWLVEDHEMHKNACRYAILAMAVWKTDKTAFPKFHRWLMINSPIPSLQRAIKFSEGLVDGNTLRKQLKSIELKDRLADNHILLHELDDKLPTIIIAEHLLQGMTKTDEELQDLLSSVMD